jgi:branched-chain amino acid transport system ATP-binding protein
MSLLEIQQVSSGYGDIQILWDIDMSLERGLLSSLVGGNGVGKTTLLRTVMGLIRPWKGTIRFQGEDVGHLSAHRKAEMGLVLVPEGRQLFGEMTVYENLEMGATNTRARPHLNRNIERVFTLFPRLKERRDQKAVTLSGGEQQMVAVARGIMAEPELLMIDELSLGLAPMLVLNLFETLQQLADEGLTMLLVEQNVHMALRVSDYAFVLSEGRVLLSGDAEEVSQQEHVRKAYLGL